MRARDEILEATPKPQSNEIFSKEQIRLKVRLSAR